MKTLYINDLDGTLLNSKLSEYTIKTLNKMPPWAKLDP
jgi:hydroxymethylpyrimidine pyrophosphatase-like HAD family hydrolase